MVVVNFNLMPFLSFACHKAYPSILLSMHSNTEWCGRKKTQTHCWMFSYNAISFKPPLTYWSYVVATTTQIINKLPTLSLSHKSPWELLFQSLPDITHLRVFGCKCFSFLEPYNTHKLQPYTSPCIFLNYPAHTKGYIFLDLVSNRIYISRHVLFNEKEFLSLSLLLYPLVLPLILLPLMFLIGWHIFYTLLH